MNLLDIARQCGAIVVNTRAFAKETRERITFEPDSQLNAFAERIRAEEREAFVTAAEKYVFAVDDSPEAVRTKDGILGAALYPRKAKP
jgi:hypothetical protein